MSKPLILNRLEMLEAVTNGFPPKPGGTPKPNPMPGGVKGQPPPAQPGATKPQPPAPAPAASPTPPPAAGAPPAPGAAPADPNAPPGAAPAAPDPASGMLASVKATVKMLEEDKPQNPTGKPKPKQPLPNGQPPQQGQAEPPPATDEADMEPVLGADGKPVANKRFVWKWAENKVGQPIILNREGMLELVLNPGMQMGAPAAPVMKAPKPPKAPHVGQGQPCKPGWSAKSTGCIPKQKPQPKVKGAPVAAPAAVQKPPAAAAPKPVAPKAAAPAPVAAPAPKPPVAASPAATPAAPAAKAIPAPVPATPSPAPKPVYAGQKQTTAANEASKAAKAGGSHADAANAHVEAAKAHLAIASKSQAAGNNAAAQAHAKVAQKHLEAAKSHQEKAAGGKAAADKPAGVSATPKPAAAVPNVPQAAAPTPASASGVKEGRQLADLTSRMLGEHLKSSNLSEGTRKDFQNAVAGVTSSMSDGALSLMHRGGLKVVGFHEDGAGVMKASVDSLRQLGNTQQADSVAQGIQKGEWNGVGGINIGGAHVHTDGDVKASTASDKGTIHEGTNVRRGILAHELCHSIDKDGLFSNSARFHVAWKEETASGKLGQYAKTSSAEGFAEFGRLLYGSEVPHERIERHFPKMSAYVKEKGLWPMPRQPKPVGNAQDDMEDGESLLPDVFGERKDLGLGDGSHADVLLNSSQEKPDDGTDAQPAEDPADAGQEAVPAGQQGGAAEGDEGQDQDGGQAAAPAAGEVADDADDNTDAEDPGAESGGDEEPDQGDAEQPADDGKPALQGPELEAAAKQMMAGLMAGFHGLMADNMHDLAGTSDEQAEADDAGQEGDPAGGGQDTAGSKGEEAADEGGDAGPPVEGAGLAKPGSADLQGKPTLRKDGPNLGKILPGATPPKKAPPVENVSHRCPNCGYTMEEDEWEDEECPQCGEVVNNEQERAPNGRFGSGDGSLAQSKTWAAVKSLASRVNALADKIPLLGKVKDVGKALMGKIHSGLEARYGPKVAGAVMGSGFLGGYGVAGTALKLFAFPGVPVVNDLVAIGVLAGVCEAGLQAGRAYRKLTGNEDLSEPREWIVDQLAQLVWKLIRQHKAELAQQAKGHEAEIAEAAKEWKQ